MNADKNGFSVPGAVGHTTAAFVNKGVHNIEFCYGPAGLRLEKKSVLYPNGEIKPLEFSLSIYEYLPCWMRYFLIGKENKGQVLYQYVTAFPVEAMVAQTWNVELAQKMGEAISEEMSEYGVSFWLGPAMNIVRNPLCGRNYEYYSEDPLLTGRMASATAKGVESRSGNYCTLKHVCANNQEAYRRTVSSDVDERALREIYWRGFEIAIREADPSSVTVAYNKLNGTYCATNHELCSDLLRDEWGFDGVIMTDWYSTGPDLADEAECISAGVDLIMPGGEETIQALTKAHKEGKLSDADINRATNRVLRAIRNTRR
jgi:beta-glucosidase